jgi:hypothetical protein
MTSTDRALPAPGGTTPSPSPATPPRVAQPAAAPSGPPPRRALDGVLAYLTDADCGRLAGGEPAALLGLTAALLPDGRLTDGVGSRPVRPYLFLGRSTDGRLAYLCHPVAPGSGQA